MAKKKTTTRRRKKSEADPAEVWAELKGQIDIETAADYSMKGSFSANSAIQHPQFGLGVITESFANKINVTFEDGVRSLVHNRP